MILYGGKLYDNSFQDELTERLRADIDRALDRDISADTVINACDVLSKRVIDGKYDDVVIPLLNKLGMDRSELEKTAYIMSGEGLLIKCYRELDEDMSIGSRVRKRYPLGAILHIAAGNADILPAYSVIEGLLAGNVNILKLPMGDQGLSVMLLRELTDIEPALTDYIYVFDVPSADTARIKRLASLCGGIAVWGGDAAVRAVRTLADPDTRIIEWGHKLSFAYAEPDCDDSELYALAENICRTDQLLCSSCQGIFVDTDSKEVQNALAERFFEILKSVSAKYPQDAGIRAKNTINVYTAELEHKNVLSGGGVSVTVCDDSDLTLSGMYRNCWVKRLPLDDIGSLRRYKGYLQTVGLLADDSRRGYISDRLARAGAVRILRPGAMSDTISGEAHDGTYALRLYSRIVETEV